MKTIKNTILVISGIVFILLGVIGIFLPLLPTTPFLLLAAACFIRSSKKRYEWLINHKFLGVYIKNYIEHRAITLKTKIATLVMLWISITISAFVFVKIWWIRFVIYLIILGVTVHILKLKTLKKEDLDR